MHYFIKTAYSLYCHCAFAIIIKKMDIAIVNKNLDKVHESLTKHYTVAEIFQSSKEIFASRKISLTP